MTQHFASLLLIALFMGSCAPATASPTPLPTAAVIQTLTPISAPSATPSPVPQTNEHLIITCDNKHWTFLNANGSLQRYLENPGFWRPEESVSPDGNWLVYEFGMDFISAAFDEPDEAAL